MRLGRRGAASVVAFLIAIILLSSMSASIMLISEEYRRSAAGGVEPVEEISEALRENLKVTLVGLSGDTVTLQIDNTGDIPVRLTKVLLKDDEGSLVTASLPDPVEVPAGGSETVTADLENALTGKPRDYSHVGIMSERGNVFTASLSSVVFTQTGLPSGTEWSVTLNGETRSTTEDSIIFEDVEPGTYLWSVSSPPPSGGTRYIASPSSGTIKVPEQTTIEITYVTQHYLSMEVSPSDGGSVSPSSGWYDEGSIVTISAVPNSGYRFDGWQGSGTGSYTGGENPATIRIFSPVTETAVFVKQGTVTFTASGLGSDASGTVLVVDGVGYSYSDLPVSFTWDAGSTHTFEWKTPIPAGSRYVWTATSGLSTERSGTITVPDDGGTISASYKKQYLLTIEASDGGTTSPAPGEYWYDAGSKVSVTAIPNSGYKLGYWLLDGVNAGSKNPYVVNMDEDHTIRAVFEIKTYTVTFTESGLPSGTEWSVTFNGQTKSSTVSTITFTGIPEGSYAWSVSTPISGGTGVRYVASPSSGTMNVPSETSQAVTYTKQYYLIMDATLSGGGSVSPSSGWYPAGSKVTISASPASGYRFDRWEGSGSGSYTGTSSSATIRMNAPIKETAYFVKTGTVTFSASGLSADASGTVLVVDGSSYSYSDLPVSFTWDAGTTHSFEWKSPVTAVSGKRYVWTSTSGLSTRRSGTITIPDGGGTISASYKTQYQLTIQTTSGGTTSPATGSYWYDSGKRVDVTANPDKYYSLSYWKLDSKNVGSKNPYTVTMHSAHTVKAYFTKNAYAVTFSAEGVGSDVTDIVLEVDGAKYTIKDLPKTFTWTVGSSHSFEWKTPLLVAEYITDPDIPGGRIIIEDKRYVWTSISGLSTSRKGTITVPIGGGEVKAQYKTQYKLTIDVSPINAEDYGVSTDPAPGWYWYDAGSKVKVTAINNAPYEVTLQADVTSSTSSISAIVNPASGVEFTSTLTVNVGSDTSPGEYKIQVTGFEYGWEFEKWVLDGKDSGTSSSITVTMNAPHTVEANFWAPSAKVTLSRSSITVPRGESGKVTVTVEKTSVPNQNIKYLTVMVPPRVTVNVKDYLGKPLSGVTVTIGGQSKKTDSNGRAVFTVQAGPYTVTVPGNAGGRDFYKWSDGVTKTSRTEKISGDETFTAIYNAIVEIIDFKVNTFEPSIYPYIATGKVVYGDPEPVSGVSVKVTFHLWHWIFGVKVVTVTTETQSDGSFKAECPSVINLIVYNLGYVDADVLSPYQSEMVVYGTGGTLYKVTFKQTGLPSGTEWKVTFGGYEQSSTGSTIEFYAPKGTYSYTVNSPIYDGDVRYVASPSSGSVTVDGEEAVSIKFSKEYRLSMKVSGSGSTSPSVGEHWYSPGTKVNIKATPSSGYRFNKWVGSGSGSYTGTSRIATITVNEPITETAYFTKTAKVTFSINSLSGVSSSTYVLTVDGKSYKRSQLPVSFTWDVGSKHSFSWAALLKAGSGKRYRWSSTSGLSTKRSDTITVPSGGSVEANYKLQYSLTITVSPSGSGTTSPSGTRWYDAGSRVSVSASPSSSFRVSLSASGLPSDASASFNPSSDTPTFTSTLKISTSSSTPSGSYTITVKGSKSGYNFGYWKLDNRWVSSSSSYAVYINAPHSLTAVFTQPKIKVDAQASTVNVEPGKSASVSVKVSTSSSEDTSDTFTLKVLKYYTVTVYVKDIHKGTAISGVTVSVDGSSKETDRYGRASFRVLEGSHTLTVPSSASAGSRGTLPFYKWSDGSTSRSHTITVSGDATYRAIYKNLLYFSSVDAWRSGSTFYAKAYVRVKGYSGSSVYASYATVKAMWTIWYWYRWWPDYITKTGTANWKGYKLLSTTITGWGITGIECTIEASKSGYVPTPSHRETVYSSSYVTVEFSASGLGSDASGTVLVVDGKGYRYSDLPVSFKWQVGSEHSFEWKSTVSIASGKRYAWKSTGGITSERSGTLTAPSGGGDVKASYKKQYYLTMKASPSSGGTVSPGSGWHDAGSTVTISASANSGYKFDRWAGSGSGSYTGYSSTATITMNDPITETAYFEEKTYMVKFKASGKPSGKSWTVTFNGEAKSSYGSTIYFYNVKSGSYSFTVDAIYDGSDTRYKPSPSSGTINVPDTTSKTVTFTRQYKLTMKRNNEDGYTSPSIGEHWYSPGSSVTIKAYAYSEYEFKKWVGSGSGSYSGTSSSATIKMNGPVTETAYFEEKSKTYTVTFKCSGLPSGTTWTVKFNGQKKSTTGSYIKFYNVEPGSYYYYVYTVSSGTGTRYKPSPTSGFIKVPDTTSKTITFTKQYRLYMKRSPTSGGSTSPTPGYHWYDSGTKVTIKAKPYSGYKFKKWIGSGTGSYTGYSSTKTITMKGPIKETAYFEKSSSGGGSTTYTVRFKRLGVPSGASWWAKLGSTKKTSTSSTITFTGVKKGSYKWSVDKYIYYKGVWYVASGSTSGTMTVKRNIYKYIRYYALY
jgi:hypothetical protein